MSEIAHRWWTLRAWVRARPEKLAWWLAWRLPRKVVLFAFVRCFGATITELSWDTNEIYRRCYDGWEAGNGR